MKKIVMLMVVALLSSSFSMVAFAEDKETKETTENKTDKKDVKKDKKKDDKKKDDKKKKDDLKPAVKGKAEVSGC